jgi:esterase/lipase
VTRLYPAREHLSFILGRSPDRALLIHGFPGTPWEVRALGELLAARGYEAHGPLLPGFGPYITSLGERSWRDWEASVRETFATLSQGAGEFIVVGYSMGAALAVRLAAEAQVDRLVLINPFTGVGPPFNVLLPLLVPVIGDYRPYLWANLDDEQLREVLARILPDLDVDDLPTRRRLRREVKIPLRALEQARRLGSAGWRAAGRVRAPTLVVQGADDPVVSPARTRRFVRRLGGPVRARLVRGGHVLVWPGKPGHRELVAELREFLNPRVEPRRTG